VRPVVGLFPNVDLDQLASHLVTQCPGDSFQFRELGASREALCIKLVREFTGHLAQTDVKIHPNLCGILAHFRVPIQIARKVEREPQTSISRITSIPLAVQTMSCARVRIHGLPAL
jgi:hypothetical protein